ncbi:protein LLP homolog [Bacillus rossius redtenbacheri]|uniref:protein LLP homolog n=1 Tax=Bacillus rossius redtenbacheri TaxID=93214 RepID=UPI002FDE7751
MAKSLRSKWRRKMRAIKRERYGEKELQRLKKMLGIDDTTTDVNMKDDNVLEFSCDGPPREGEEAKEAKGAEPGTSGSPAEKLPVYDLEEEREQEGKWTMKLMNEFGTYPVWMHHRKIRTAAKLRKKMKNARNKKVGKK